MHLRRIAAFVLGAWLIGSLFVVYVHTRRDESAQIILSRPTREIGTMMQALGPEKLEMLLRYHSAEQERDNNAVWGITQLILAAALGVLLIYATHVNRLAIGLCGAMFVMALFGCFVLAPEISFLAQGLAFNSGWSENRARYLALRATFLLVEIVKLGLGGVLAGYLFLYRSPGVRRRVNLEPDELAAGVQPGHGSM